MRCQSLHRSRNCCVVSSSLVNVHGGEGAHLTSATSGGRLNELLTLM